jgi:hypothetical protein
MGTALGEFVAGFGSIRINGAGIGFGGSMAALQGSTAGTLAPEFEAGVAPDDEVWVKLYHRLASRYLNGIVSLAATGSAGQAIQFRSRFVQHAGDPGVSDWPGLRSTATPVPSTPGLKPGACAAGDAG